MLIGGINSAYRFTRGFLGLTVLVHTASRAMHYSKGVVSYQFTFRRSGGLGCFIVVLCIFNNITKCSQDSS